MNLLAISGSLKTTSTNTMLLRALTALAPESVQVTFYEGLATLPHFSPDLDPDDRDHAPQLVQEWRTMLQKADAVVICTPEYAYGMPGSLKNALDWAVSSGEFLEKPVAVMSASPSSTGGARAHSALVSTLTALSATMIEGTSLIVPLIKTKLDANGNVIDPTLRQSLISIVDVLLAVTTERKVLPAENR